MSPGPDDAEALRAAGMTARRLHNWDAARSLLDEALRLEPASVAGWIERIGLESDLQNHDEALGLLDRALAEQPDARRLLEGRPILLWRAGRADEAKDALLAMLAADDRLAWAHHQLGRIVADSDRPRANAHLRRAVELEPADPAYRMALARSLMRLHVQDEGAGLQEAHDLVRALGAEGALPRDAVFTARSICQQVCDFDGVDGFGDLEALGRDRALAGDHSALFNLLGAVRGDRDRRELLEQHRTWGRAAEAKALRNPIVRAPALRRPGKLRLGLMSSDLRNHPVGYFALPLFEFPDKERFELHAYSFNRAAADGAQAYFAARADVFRWRPEISDRDAAQMIADDDVDLLIEIGGSTHMNRLEVMAWRPARLQASWLGYPHSAGLEAIDHIVVDPYIAPEDPSLLVETPMVMPHSWLALGGARFNDRVAVDPVTPEARNGVLTFGTANSPAKFNAPMLRTWARVLAAVPASRLMIVRPEAGAPAFQANIARVFAAEGVGPERLLFRTTWGGHLPYYNEIDISLDTFPLVGGTTTCESLWMGVPVVSLVGEALFERLGLSLLTNAGLGDLAVRSLDDYVATAVGLAADPARRGMLRAILRDQVRSGPLGRTEAFARDFYDMAAAAIEAAG